MSNVERKVKRERAFNKLNNQLSVLSRTVVQRDKKLVTQIQELTAQLTLAK